MTNTEAIKKLDQQKTLLCFDCRHPQTVEWCEEHCQVLEAYNMAINALKAQEQPANGSPELDNNFGDLISRAAAQTELMMKCERYTLARESHGMGHVEWSDELIDLSDAMDAIRDLPSAQSEKRTQERTETHACDCISRKAAIGVIAKWMLEYGGEGEERERNALKQAAEEIKELPSAQPEIIRCRKCRYKKRKGVDYFCDHITGEEIMVSPKDYCSWAERGTDG